MKAASGHTKRHRVSGNSCLERRTCKLTFLRCFRQASQPRLVGTPGIARCDFNGKHARHDSQQKDGAFLNRDDKRGATAISQPQG